MSRRNSLDSKRKRRDERNEVPAFNPKGAPVSFAVKTALKLQKLPLEKLHRRLKTTARRAATCRYLIASLSKNSMFAEKIKDAQKHELFLLRQVRAEITSRILKKS